MKFMQKILSKVVMSHLQNLREIRDQLLLIGGLSKSHSATGIRIGFLLGPEYPN